MTSLDLIGLPVTDAVAMLMQKGLEPLVSITTPPSPAFDAAGRTLRVVSLQGNRLIAAYFRDGEPGEKEITCK